MNKEEYYSGLCRINKKAFKMFEKYKFDSDTFFETGCHTGETCIKAVMLGYKNIFSCDISHGFVTETINKLRPHDVNYLVETMDSSLFLKHIAPQLDQKTTFWLDAHSWGGGCPTFDELEVLKQCAVRNDHTILIDDLHIFFRDTLLDKLKNKILQINENYRFEFINLHDDGSDNVLVAYIKG
jgi:hypothetical protein